ncbi:MAG: nucleotide exchange factor GrpE [Clostridia bacterium]|nr:nucleotide exchange factor GrpE [Clostridia bacterium]
MAKDKKKKVEIKAEDLEKMKAKAGEVSDNTQPKADDDLGIDRDALTDKEYIEKLEELVVIRNKEASECKAIAQRLQADFDNYRKRTNSMGEEMKHFGESLVIEKMLTVLDNCDLARKYLQDQAALQGFNMMETQILSALEGFGLKEVDALNKDFDAKFMTCYEREKTEDESKDGKVTEVSQKGYTLNGKLLRAASVKVAYMEIKSED